MLLDSLTQKLVTLEKELSAEKGGFYLFALLRRVATEGYQDLVVSAPWLDADSDVHLHTVITLVKDALTKEEMQKISAVVILPPSHPVVQALNTFVAVEHANVQAIDNIINGLHIKGGLIVTSNRKP